MIDVKNKFVYLTFFILFSFVSFINGQITLYNSGSLTVPNNVCKITVEVVGAGGGGGYSDDRGLATGGGGGGGYAKATISVVPGQSISYVVGSGGSGGSGTNHGGSSWFLSSSSVYAEGGRGAVNNSTNGGQGGIGVVNPSDESVVIRSGGAGGKGSGDGDCHATGGGGSAAGPNSNGVDGVDGNRGTGGTCSGKQGGNGGVLTNSWFTSTGGRGNENGIGGQGVVGNNASGYGSGGGGGKRGSALIFEGGAKSGGDGTNGIIRVTYHYAPTVAVTGPVNICSGGSATLNTTTTNTTQYTWSTAATTRSITVSPTNTTTYVVSATSASGCSVSASHTVNVTAASVKPTSINGLGQYCIGNEVVLTQIGGFTGANFEWYSGVCGGTLIGIGNSITISPTTTMNVFVRAQQNGVCPSTLCEGGVVEVNSAGNTLAYNNDLASCPVKENNWVHFYKNGRLVASINSGGQNLGRVDANAFVDVGNQLIPACGHEDNELFMTSVMNRHWVLTPQFQPITPVRVRLPFYNGDFDNLMNATIDNLNPTDNVYAVEDIMLSKYHGSIYVNENAIDNCIGLLTEGNTDIYQQVSNGLVNTYASINNASFVEYVIPNFSEFWLHGSSILSPLGNFLNGFKVECGKIPTVELNIEQAQLIGKVVVTASNNGEVWGERMMWNQSQLILGNQKLSFEDLLGINAKYYKVELFDVMNNLITHKIIANECLATITDLQLYPNPATDKVYVKWASESMEAEYSVLSIEGKIVSQGSVKHIEAIDLQNLSAGSYTIIITLKSGEKAIQRLIKK